MSETTTPATRSFLCNSCRGEIQIPYDLPPTTGPCPHCRSSITSPPPPGTGPAPAPAGREPLELAPEQRATPPAAPERKPGAVGPIPAPAGLPSAPRTDLPAAGSAPPGLKTLAEKVAGGGVAVPPLDYKGKDPEAPTNAVGVSAPAAQPPAAKPAKSGKRRMHPAIPFSTAILLIVGVLVGLVVIKRKDTEVAPPVVQIPPKPPVDEEARRQFLRDGWKQYATNTLTAFLRATTPEEKARYVVGGESRVEEMRKFYGSAEKIDDSDTPIDLFTHFDLDIADKERGLFLMQFERPAQYDMKEFFRPVAPLEVQHLVEEPGLLLSAFAARENFAMQPVRVMAFFKEVNNKLLLDWSVFTQTKYRSLLHFKSNAQPGNSQVFRVMAREVLPAVPGPDSEEPGVAQRYFRFSDPAHPQDHLDVPVDSESLPGKILADLAFINIPNKEPQNRYATIELGWTEGEEPGVVLRKLICWEFLDLGGMEGNADPVEEDPAESAVSLDSLEPDPLGPAAPPTSAGTTPEPVVAPTPGAFGEAEGTGQPGEDDESPGEPAQAP